MKILKYRNYFILGLFIAVFFFALGLFLEKKDYIWFVLQSDSFIFFEKISLVFASLKYQAITDWQVVPWRTATNIFVSILAGINFSLLAFYFKKRFILYKSSGSSLLGLISGILGVGCPACGSVLLSSVIGFSATTGFIGWLPLGGLEFGLLAVILLLTSIALLWRKMRQPLVC